MNIDEKLDLIDEAFQPSSPIHDLDFLAGRDEQLFQLTDHLRTVGAHAVIYGERGVGKSSVATVFAETLRRQRKRVFHINCSVMDGMESLWRAMFQEWMSLSPDDEYEYLSRAGEAITQQGVVRDLRYLTHSDAVVLIFDEFDCLANDAVGEDFSALMKAISDARLHAHIVLVGIAEDIDSILFAHRSAGRGLRQVRVPRLEDEELAAILAKGFTHAQISLPEELRNRVIRLAQRLPHYAHSYGRQLARAAAIAERGEVVVADWIVAVGQVLKNAEQQVKDLYASAVNPTKPGTYPELLVGSALAKKDNLGFFSPQDVKVMMDAVTGSAHNIQTIRANLGKLSSDDRGPALQSRQFGGGANRYRFVDPLLQPYVLTRAVETGLIAERLDDVSLWRN